MAMMKSFAASVVKLKKNGRCVKISGPKERKEQGILKNPRFLNTVIKNFINECWNPGSLCFLTYRFQWPVRCTCQS